MIQFSQHAMARVVKLTQRPFMHLLNRGRKNDLSPEPGQRLPQDLPDEDQEIIRKVLPFTMTSVERVYALIQAVRYIERAGVPGSVVECGVWKGGSMMAASLTLKECGSFERELYMYDTYEGMTNPTELDISLTGQSAVDIYSSKEVVNNTVLWCDASLDEVRQNLESTGYPQNLIHYVKGRVEHTIPKFAPDKIAILRLDTDWYESTKHELEHLYPRLVSGGVILIDDYGHWKGCRKATDEYFTEAGINILLNRIDYTGRIAIKV